jgi:5-methylcytosine-specific restriction endonuclease McrA
LVASRAWKTRNKSLVKAYAAGWHAANRAANNARSRKRHREHAAEDSVYRRRLYEERQRATNAATVHAYRQRNPGSQAEIENRRRSRLLGAFVETVSAAEIRERDAGRCGLCGEFVPLSEQSLDHIVPLAHGGTHERSNLQLAHRRCNSRKGARPVP